MDVSCAKSTTVYLLIRELLDFELKEKYKMNKLNNQGNWIVKAIRRFIGVLLHYYYAAVVDLFLLQWITAQMRRWYGVFFILFYRNLYLVQLPAFVLPITPGKTEVATIRSNLLLAFLECHPCANSVHSHINSDLIWLETVGASAFTDTAAEYYPVLLSIFEAYI